MKSVIQVVGETTLSVENEIISKIKNGMVVYFCVEKGDSDDMINYFAKKIAGLRIFKDDNGKTNLSIKEVGGEILLVSQFTLAGDCEHGNRPYFIGAEQPERANKLYLELAEQIRKNYEIPVLLGVFGAEMTIKQTNLGPFTIILEK